MTWITYLANLVKPKMETPYTNLYNTAQTRPEKRTEIANISGRIMQGWARYEAVAATLANGIPWWFIGITHFMEAGIFQNPFAFHLHCGDPLYNRTFHVPAGRPKFNPGHGSTPPSHDNPYSWEESALDALRLMKYDRVQDWSIENCLVLFEKFNGMGYKRRGVPSPYLWSYSQHYTKGKYVLDGKYDPEKVSKQPGVAVLMKALGV